MIPLAQYARACSAARGLEQKPARLLRSWARDVLHLVRAERRARDSRRVSIANFKRHAGNRLPAAHSVMSVYVRGMGWVDLRPRA